MNVISIDDVSPFVYESVLVATDGSEGAARAVDHAIVLARRLDVPLYVLYVCETRTAYDSDIVDPEQVRATQRAKATDTVSEIRSKVDASDEPIDIETAILDGVPHEEILTYASERDVGVIVIGARGKSSFKRVVLGSTIDAVVRLSDRPVLVIDSEYYDRESE